MFVFSETDLSVEGPHVPGSQLVCCRQYRSIWPFCKSFLLNSKPSHWGKFAYHKIIFHGRFRVLYFTFFNRCCLRLCAPHGTNCWCLRMWSCLERPVSWEMIHQLLSLNYMIRTQWWEMLSNRNNFMFLFFSHWSKTFTFEQFNCLNIMFLHLLSWKSNDMSVYMYNLDFYLKECVFWLTILYLLLTKTPLFWMTFCG